LRGILRLFDGKLVPARKRAYIDGAVMLRGDGRSYEEIAGSREPG
jgi:hypothetical protein